MDERNFIRRATVADKQNVIGILRHAFDENPAVNDTLYPDNNREERIRALMDYLVETGLSKSGVYITTDGTGAIIMYDPVQYPDRFSDTLRQLKLVHRCIGWSRLNYASSKNKKMRSFRPDAEHFYLAMIGTSPAAQGKGIGSNMISFIQNLASNQRKDIYLETSVRKNVDMYLKKGFEITGDWKIRDDYHVHFMKCSIQD